jgi:hypothetical protein
MPRTQIEKKFTNVQTSWSTPAIQFVIVEGIAADENAPNNLLVVTIQKLSTFLVALSLERIFWTGSWFGKIGVGAVDHWRRVAMAELTLHGIIGSLVALIRFHGTLATVGIIFQVVGGMIGHELCSSLNCKFTASLRFANHPDNHV